MWRTSIRFTLGVALTLLPACSTTQSAQDTTVATPTPTTTTITTDLTTTTSTSIVPPQTTTAPATNPPATTIPKKKTTAAPQVPQMQLTGTPQEQANQVVAAVAKVAAIQDYGTRTLKLYSLKQSVSSYGITISEDPGTRLYTISAGGQTACFLWDYVDIANSDAYGLVRHACS